MEPGSEYTEVIKRDGHRWADLVGKRADAFKQAPGAWQKWRALLPLSMQARLVWAWLKGRFVYAPFERFALVSILRIVPVLGLLVGFFAAAAWWQGMTGRADKDRGTDGTDGTQAIVSAKALSFDALGLAPELTREEAALWLAFGKARDQAKQKFVREAFANAGKAERAFARADLLAHAIVGLDATGERSKNLLHTHIMPVLQAPESTASVQLLALRLAAELRLTPDDGRSLAALAADIAAKPEMPGPAAAQFGEALLALMPALVASNSDVKPLARALALRMASETDIEALKRLAAGLGALPAGLLEAADAQPAIKALMLRMQNEADMAAVASITLVLGHVAHALEPKDAQAVAKMLQARMLKAGDAAAMASLGQAIATLGPALPAAEVRALAKALAARIADAPYSDVVVSFAQALAAMAPALPAGEMQSLAQVLVRRLAYETNGDVVVGVGAALATLAAKLEPAPARQLAQVFLERVSTELDSSSLARLALAMAALMPVLQPADVAPMAKEMAARMEKETDSTVLARLGHALGPLASALQRAEIQPATAALAARMASEADSTALARLGHALAALGAAFEPADAQTLAKVLIARMEKEADVYTAASLGGALAALAPKLDAADRARLAALLAKRVETEHAQRAELARAWVEVQAARPERDRREVMQAYSDLLARPLVVGAAQTELLRGLEALTGEVFQGNLWQFVAWATSDAGRSLSLQP